MDSPHTEDMTATCAGCGSHWRRDGTLWIMNHVQPCRYLEDLEYGAEREINQDG